MEFELQEIGLSDLHRILGLNVGVLPSEKYEDLKGDEVFHWPTLLRTMEQSLSRELEPEEKLHFASLLQCVEDWISLFAIGSVANGRRQSFSHEDAVILHDFLFSDHHGDNDPNFVSLRTICERLEIDIDAFRKKMLRFGNKATLVKLPLLTEAALRQRANVGQRRRDVCRREASARRVAVFKQVRRSGCRVCAEPEKQHNKDEVFVHKIICETRDYHVS